MPHLEDMKTPTPIPTPKYEILLATRVVEKHVSNCNKLLRILSLYFGTDINDLILTPFSSGTGVNLLTCPYLSGSVMLSGMRLLPTNLPVPKTNNPNTPAFVHLTMGVNSQKLSLVLVFISFSRLYRAGICADRPIQLSVLNIYGLV